MNLRTTVYGVFIIESLKNDDYFDGDNLHGILNVANIPSIYKEALSKDHLKELLHEFKRSKFRYLYLSCHANELGVGINGESISNRELQQLAGDMRDIRIFMSACKGGNVRLAKLLIGRSNILSLIGSSDNIDQDKAAVFWPAFFYVMKELDEEKMARSVYSTNLKKLVDLFNLPINYYSRIKDDQLHLRRLKIRPNKPTDNWKVVI